MAGLDVTDAEFLAQSRRRGRKYSSLLILLSAASYFGARMLMDSTHDDAVMLAWASVGFAVSATLMLVVVMPMHTLFRKRRRFTS
jgi:hypothetical protein